MSGKINLKELRERAENKASAYPTGLLKHMAVAELPADALLALVEAVEAAQAYLRGTAGDPMRERLQDALARFEGGAS